MSPRTLVFRATVILLLSTLVVTVSGYAWCRFRSVERAVSVEFLDDVAAPIPSRAGLRIGAYNIAHGRGGVLGASNLDGGSPVERLNRLRSIGELIASLDLDVVVLNEVDFSAWWSGHLDQAAVISEAGGYPYIARQHNLDVWSPFARLRFGNAILSRFPITRAEFRKFEPLSKIEAIFVGNHDALSVDLSLADGASITVWGVHLEVRSLEVRVAAARRILAAVEQSENPLVVAGDFNSRYPKPSDRTTDTIQHSVTAVSLLIDSQELVPFPDVNELPANPTFPSENPDRTIDWILYSPQWQASDGRVTASGLSDHLPVSLELRLPNR